MKNRLLADAQAAMRERNRPAYLRNKARQQLKRKSVEQQSAPRTFLATRTDVWRCQQCSFVTAVDDFADRHRKQTGHRIALGPVLKQTTQCSRL